ncbi:MAG: NAD(P)-dependent oxidoreductase [Candidatus Heimdallarchaeota archaeon]|nr:NAD(P)-dependent oxidoreductase [Candidatus Heimdallarchaeota archaeon]
MNILITGPFGQVGSNILEKLPTNKYNIKCFDIKNNHTRKVARKYRSKIDICWGDIRNVDELELAFNEPDIIIHLAYIIPPINEKNLKYAEEVNISGTRNVLDLAIKQSKLPKILFASSVIIYGDTRKKTQPISVDEEFKPIDYYAHHKVQCMQMIKESGLNYSIFVLGVVPPIHKLIYDPMMYEVPIETKIELIHEKDVGLAFINALENEKIWNRTWHIGGGPSCRLNYLDFVQSSMTNMGLGTIPLNAFGGSSYHSSLLNSEESNLFLNYQKHSYEDILRDMYCANRLAISLIRCFKPIIKKFLIKQSPYIHTKK